MPIVLEFGRTRAVAGTVLAVAREAPLVEGLPAFLGLGPEYPGLFEPCRPIGNGDRRGVVGPLLPTRREGLDELDQRADVAFLQLVEDRDGCAGQPFAEGAAQIRISGKKLRRPGGSMRMFS